MSDFSRLLREYTKRSGYTKVNLSKLCGIDRSLLQKYVSGHRIPNQVQTVLRLAEVLQLSPGERQKFLEAYYIKSIGAKAYEQRQMIQDVIEHFSSYIKKEDLKFKGNFSGCWDDVPEIMILGQENNNWEKIGRILEMEAVHDSAELLLIAQPDKDYLNGLISYFLSFENTKVKQIVCVENWIADQKGNHNIKILCQVMPFLFGTDRYEAKFYYDHLESHRNNMTILPNLLITRHFVICFNNDMKSGILYKNEIVHKFYRGVFYEIEKECRSYYHIYHSAMDNLIVYHKKERCRACIQMDLCVLPILTKEQLYEIVNPDLQDGNLLVERLYELESTWKEEALEEGEPIINCIFSHRGLESFVQHGRILEIPEGYCKPVPKEMRIQILEKLFDYMKQGYCLIRMIDDTKMHLDKHLIIDLCGHSTAYIIYVQKNLRNVMVIEELSVVKALEDYLYHLPYSEWVLSEEYTYEQIKDAIDWLKNE